jgi:hypothetical protein
MQSCIKKSSPSIRKQAWLIACITAPPWPTRYRVVFGGRDRVFLNSAAPYACSGREKGACDLAPEASADQFDFPSPRPSPGLDTPFDKHSGLLDHRRERGSKVSASLAGRNLHLVISGAQLALRDPAAGSPYSIINL